MPARANGCSVLFTLESILFFFTLMLSSCVLYTGITGLRNVEPTYPVTTTTLTSIVVGDALMLQIWTMYVACRRARPSCGDIVLFALSMPMLGIAGFGSLLPSTLISSDIMTMVSPASFMGACTVRGIAIASKHCSNRSPSTLWTVSHAISAVSFFLASLAHLISISEKNDIGNVLHIVSSFFLFCSAMSVPPLMRMPCAYHNGQPEGLSQNHGREDESKYTVISYVE